MVNARSKGQRGEREVVGLLQPIVDKVCAELGYQTIVLCRNLVQSREGGCDISGLPYVAIEVKRHENVSGLPGWWRQAVEQAGRMGKVGRDKRVCVPVLLYRTNNQPWKCRLRLPVRIGKADGAKSVAMTCNVDIESFLAWFEARLRYELGA